MIRQLQNLLTLRKTDVHNAHVKTLKDLASASNAQNDKLQVLTEEMHKDSRSVRILTFIALVYLPASLMAVSYPVVHPCQRDFYYMS